MCGEAGWAGRKRVDAAVAHLDRTVTQVQQAQRPPALRAADLLAAQREPVPREVVGSDSSRGQLSPKFDAGQTGCKVATATDSDGWVASRLQAARARHLDTFVHTCALGWRQSTRELSSCSGRRAIDPQWTAERAAGGPPSRAPGVCTGSSGSLRVRALLIRPDGHGT